MLRKKMKLFEINTDNIIDNIIDNDIDNILNIDNSKKADNLVDNIIDNDIGDIDKNTDNNINYKTKKVSGSGNKYIIYKNSGCKNISVKEYSEKVISHFGDMTDKSKKHQADGKFK